MREDSGTVCGGDMKLKRITAYTEVVNELKPYTRNIYIEDGDLWIRVETKGDAESETLVDADYWNISELNDFQRVLDARRRA